MEVNPKLKSHSSKKISSLYEGWIEAGYSHIHFGAIILALNYHGVEGKPVVARIALLDTKYFKYQDACIGTVEATMNNGLVMVTLFPNFTMALEDPNLMDALKVQIHIVGAQQVESSIIATLHYQIVYRVQDHVFRLGGCGSNDSLLITVNTQEQPHCVHIPRQIPKDEMIQLLPERWVTSYDQIHAIKQPIRSTNTKIISKGDGTSEIRIHNEYFDVDGKPILFFKDSVTGHCPWNEDCSCEQCVEEDFIQNMEGRYHTSYNPHKKNKKKKKNSIHSQLYQRWKNGDPTVGPLGEDNGKFIFLVDYGPRRKEESLVSDAVPQRLPPPDSLPRPFIQKGETSSVSTALLQEDPETENALAQNATLQRINARVAQMDTKITMVETKVDSNTKIANELIVCLHRMLKEAEKRHAEPGQDHFYYVEQKNQEIQRLKDHIKYLQEHGLPPTVQPGETLFPAISRSDPVSVFSPFERRTPHSPPSVFHCQPIEPKRLVPYEFRELIRKQEAEQKREREERERKGKSHEIQEEEGPVPKVSRSLMIRDEQQQNPLSSFLKGYKEAIIPRIAALNTEETEQSSEQKALMTLSLLQLKPPLMMKYIWLFHE
ncbi:hypothetical protein V6N11_075409 [Hibiscus sabdariffa]|uniref:Uncharacterized protein n=1 Tax=Hibiscus sabdariffa TaxID=183260 RepID=A0ABR2R6F0_9ROSI